MMEVRQTTSARQALGIIESAENGQSAVATSPTQIADAVESGGYGRTWVFHYQGVKDTTPRWRVATLLPPEGDKPTLVGGSHFVGYDPLAVDRRTGEVGGFRHFKFLNMGGLTPVEEGVEFTPE